ncbi:hypothetical protein F751_6416 [Auxenochlorella protothecoides]|uniref:Uncharacterized protein n=1 Tax=Auxenochlorella protothecoides TaxID=3075 RepID=A0A087SB03_AUXPR|nr:hypothetical protein F751_6416 [Auxenochlorella protothecoides]KFM22907.1 hypothetical protein F751_6416 [Auxenochlorella protothecoides]
MMAGRKRKRKRRPSEKYMEERLMKTRVSLRRWEYLIGFPATTWMTNICSSGVDEVLGVLRSSST